MDCDATGAIEQRRGIAAVHSAEGIVDAAIRCSLEHRMPALNLDQIQAEFFDHRRLAVARHHGTDLLKAVERVILAIHVAYLLFK